MTVKEAIAYLEDPLSLPEGMDTKDKLEWHEKAVSMAIEALKAQNVPDTNVEDTISRQATIDRIDAIAPRKTDSDYQKGIAVGMAMAKVAIIEQESAQPKMVCVANVTLTEEQVQEVFEKAKRSVLSVIEPEKTKQPEIICCRECKHRPTLDENGKPDFPTYRCPCRCEDFYYSWMPEDDWFCGNAERRTDER